MEHDAGFAKGNRVLTDIGEYGIVCNIRLDSNGVPLIDVELERGIEATPSGFYIARVSELKRA
jgi:hypothetical protein